MIGKIKLTSTEPAKSDPTLAHKWKPREDALACVECGEYFKIGDMVYSHVAVSIHIGCLDAYRVSLREMSKNPVGEKPNG